MSSDPHESETGDELARARIHCANLAWADAHAAFVLADQREKLGVEDLERLAQAAMLIGLTEEALATSERLHQAYFEAGSFAQAARCAFWAGFRLSALGERGRAGAWMSRAQRLVERLGGECSVRGYLLLPTVHRHVAAGQFVDAYAVATQALEIGECYADRDLIGFARNMQGRTLLRMGKLDEGLRLMDEVMLAATSGELSPTMTGLVYCSLIAGCQQAFALDRASEWTHVLERWWQAQPQIVAFTGACLVHRAELLQLNGAWAQAIVEAGRATTPILCAAEPQAAADAHYQQGEIYRLRGEHALAEAAYRDASQLGREPQPGLALLRLAQGRLDAATQAIRRVLSSAQAPLQRVQYLPAFCEIMLAADALDEARNAGRELDEIATSFGGEFLMAMAAHAQGALSLAEGNPQAALAPLRRALGPWQRVAAPYIVARLRVLVARACRALGDEDGAALELDAARGVFQQLGAAAALADLASLTGAAADTAQHNLSPRELQVLRLIAAGKTNKLIARELGLSEKTIDRHVSNILTKLDVSSRAAATAYAYEHKLI
jgi:DNA-binding CsgD family transcriptional regulator